MPDRVTEPLPSCSPTVMDHGDILRECRYLLHSISSQISILVAGLQRLEGHQRHPQPPLPPAAPAVPPVVSTDGGHILDPGTYLSYRPLPGGVLSNALVDRLPPPRAPPPITVHTDRGPTTPTSTPTLIRTILSVRILALRLFARPPQWCMVLVNFCKSSG